MSVSSCHSGARSLSPAVGTLPPSPLSRGCLPPGRQWGRAERSLGTREAHPRPHLLLQLGRRARAPGQRLCFPDSNYVCGSAASAGDAAPLPCTPRMTGGARAAGGGSGAGRRPPRSRCTVEAREPGWRRPTHLAAFSCAGRGEPCLRGAGRRLGAPGRRRAGQSAACRSGGSLLSRGCSGRQAGGRAGAAAGCEPGGASDGGLAQPLRDLLSAPPPARVLGPASPPPLPSLATGWTRFRAELEDRAPGAALRLLRRRMRRAPPPRPPALWGRPRDPGSSPAKVARPRREKEESGRCPIPLHPHPTTPNSSC